MAGALTITEQGGLAGNLRPVRKVTLAWTSTAGGAVSGNLTDTLSGELVRVVFKPGSGGTQPSDLYDVTLLDEQGVDVLAGQGANLSNATATAICPGVPLKDAVTTSTTACRIDDKLDLNVAAAGASKTGQLILYLRS